MPTPNTVYSGYVYFIGNQEYLWYKIGKSRNPDIRLDDIGILLPFPIKVFAIWKAENHHDAEIAMHKRYSEFHIHGEWFKIPRDVRQSIIDGDPPFFGHRIFPSEKEAKWISFTNMPESVPDAELGQINLRIKKQMFDTAWNDFFEKTGVDRKSNKSLARLYFGVLTKNPKAVIELKAMKASGAFNRLPEKVRALFAVL